MGGRGGVLLVELMVIMFEQHMEAQVGCKTDKHIKRTILIEKSRDQVAAGWRCMLAVRHEVDLRFRFRLGHSFVVFAVSGSRILWIRSRLVLRVFSAVSSFFPSLKCTEVRSDLSEAPEPRGRLEGSPPRPPVGVSLGLDRPTAASDTAVDLHTVAAHVSPPVLLLTPPVRTEGTGPVLRPGLAAGPGGTGGRCGAEAAGSRGLTRPVQLTSSR